jgi:NAD(P)-dependent dehydrogenase (short-subunit alcohol dehydrogenase family)
MNRETHARHPEDPIECRGVPHQARSGAMTRWVLVTGGAARLGRETCLAFARAGWNVACHYHSSAAAAASLRDQLEALGVQSALEQGALDSLQDAERLFGAVLRSIGGPPDCIVNNASRFEPDGAADFSERSLLGQLQTNLIVPVTLARLLHEQWKTRGSADASVIHLLDQKVFNLNPDYFSYTLSKLALERAVAQQAQALAPVVRVNAVAPGLLYPSGPQSRKNFTLASQVNLRGRATDPGKVAETVLFLAENPCITGASLCVDNGQHLVPSPRDIMFMTEEFLKKGAR